MRYGELVKPNNALPVIVIDLLNKLDKDGKIKHHRRQANLQKLFYDDGFFNQYMLTEQLDGWYGVRVHKTKKSKIPYIVLKSSINGEEIRISSKKLRRKIMNDEFGFELLEFESRTLKF